MYTNEKFSTSLNANCDMRFEAHPRINLYGSAEREHQGLLKRWTVLSPLRGLFLFVFLFQSGKRFKSMIATQRFEKKMKNGAHFSTHSNNVAC